MTPNQLLNQLWICLMTSYAVTFHNLMHKDITEGLSNVLLKTRHPIFIFDTLARLLGCRHCDRSHEKHGLLELVDSSPPWHFFLDPYPDYRGLPLAIFFSMHIWVCVPLLHHSLHRSGQIFKNNFTLNTALRKWKFYTFIIRKKRHIFKFVRFWKRTNLERTYQSYSLKTWYWRFILLKIVQTDYFSIV